MVLAARADLMRALDGFDDASGALRLGGLNEVAWMVAHLAFQEQAYWLLAFDRDPPRPQLAEYRRSRPDPVMPLSQALDAYRAVSAATEPFLLGLRAEDLERRTPSVELQLKEPIGVLCLRVFGHHYVHIGQITAVRRWLGMPVPPFVGRLPLPDSDA
jgi:uncharacterized damage-inducible protein DinB